MKNMFEANIILCERMEKGNRPKGLFNNIEIEENENVMFDVGIFFVANINRNTKETFLLDIIYKDGMDKNRGPINMLGSVTKKYTKNGLSRALLVFRDNTVDFRWEGIYALELRHCDKYVNIDEKTDEEMIEIINNSDIINTFTFSVGFKK